MHCSLPLSAADFGAAATGMEFPSLPSYKLIVATVFLHRRREKRRGDMSPAGWENVRSHA